MSPPLLGVEGASQGNASLVASQVSMDSISPTGFGLKERNYLGLSDCSSVDSSPAASLSEESKGNLNLKATELRLGLPGCQSPEREQEFDLLGSGKLDEKPLFPLAPSKDGICCLSQKAVVSGNKRGFSDTMDNFSEIKGSGFAEGNWMFNVPRSDSETPKSVGHGKFASSASINVMLSSGSAVTHAAGMKEVPIKASQEGNLLKTGNPNKVNGSNNNNSTPAAK